MSEQPTREMILATIIKAVIVTTALIVPTTVAITRMLMGHDHWETWVVFFCVPTCCALMMRVAIKYSDPRTSSFYFH